MQRECLASWKGEAIEDSERDDRQCNVHSWPWKQQQLKQPPSFWSHPMNQIWTSKPKEVFKTSEKWSYCVATLEMLPWLFTERTLCYELKYTLGRINSNLPGNAAFRLSVMREKKCFSFPFWPLHLLCFCMRWLFFSPDSDYIESVSDRGRSRQREVIWRKERDRKRSCCAAASLHLISLDAIQGFLYPETD